MRTLAEERSQREKRLTKSLDKNRRRSPQAPEAHRCQPGASQECRPPGPGTAKAQRPGSGPGRDN
jgi:hypothetical protein